MTVLGLWLSDLRVSQLVLTLSGNGGNHRRRQRDAFVCHIRTAASTHHHDYATYQFALDVTHNADRSGEAVCGMLCVTIEEESMKTAAEILQRKTCHG